MSDEVFYDSTTMSEADIQAFLNSKRATCTAGYTCLKDYRTPTISKAASAGRCNGYAASSSESAARIIFNVSQSCDINPKVLIVLLEKEQGLVTSSAPSAGRYRSATGYACPDTAACDVNYYGFFNQVYHAALQFQIYRTAPQYFNHQAGRNNTVKWHPSSACGTSTVYIKNQATAGLYNYTPYRPNAAALNNMYGLGDGCSSYGNRNFFAFYTDWFGSTNGGANDPRGSLEATVVGNESLRLSGWGLDPDTANSIDVHVYVDGVGAAVFTANLDRPDVARHYPALGSKHGFDKTINVAAGERRVCVYLFNVGAGGNTLLSCQEVTVPSSSPVGSLELIQAQPGGVRVSGWALDPDTTGPLDVHVYIGSSGHARAANLARADIGRVYPAWGPNHGFDITLPADSGSHNVCVYAINVGRGGHALLGCKTITVMSGSPIGAIDSVTSNSSGIRVSGWALDPDVSGPIDVHVYVGTAGYAVRADLARSDIARVFPVYGGNHGFDSTIQASAGTHNVCAYAINVESGSTVAMGCRSVTVRSGSPIGALDAVSASSSSITASGWAIDPDTSASIPVHIYIGPQGYAVSADLPRSDIGRIFSYGANHGFSNSFASVPGDYNVCAYAIDSVGGHPHTLLGCKPVTVR
ncbi:hypothetical protein GCM10027416_06040 [Okibacterium endophyticum]